MEKIYKTSVLRLVILIAVVACGQSYRALANHSIPAGKSSLVKRIKNFSPLPVLLINQFNPQYTNSTDSYIELVNTTSSPINLSAYKIVYQAANGTAGGAGGTLTGTIPANGFWLLATNTTVIANAVTFSRDGALSSGFSATDGQLAIEKVSDNSKIDGLAYGTITTNNLGNGTSSTALTGNTGLMRATDGADNGTNSTDFVAVTSIRLRTSLSRLANLGASIPSGTYTDISVTGNSTTGTATILTGQLNLTTGTFTLPALGSLQVAGAITHASGFVGGTATSSLSLSNTAANAAALFFDPSSNNLKDLAITGSITLGNALNLYGTFSMNGNSATFATAGFLTLKSTTSGDAAINDLTNNSANSGNTITGSVTVEKYVPNLRAWRLVTSPVSGAETINQAWQEGGSSSNNPNAGYGTYITGGTTGFDGTAANASSLKTYDITNDVWNAVTSTAGSVNSATGFMLFVRGDRTAANLFSNGSSATTLRTTGALRTGTQTDVPVAASGYTIVGNPYAAPIDFSKVVNGFPNRFYVWDPALSSAGAFVLVDDSGNTGTYTVTPSPDGSAAYSSSVSALSNIIGSGQAFFVANTGAGGKVSFTESSKVPLGISKVRAFGVVQHNSAVAAVTPANMIINLQTIATNNSFTLIDGTQAIYAAGFSNAVDGLDAGKMNNFNENVALTRSNKQLALERRNALTGKDTLHIQLWNVLAQSYNLSLTPKGFTGSNVTATLNDNFLHTKTAMVLNQVNNVQFTVTADTNSYRNRFTIGMDGGQPAYAFVSVAGKEQQKNVAVNFSVANDQLVKQYEVQKMIGGNFTTIDTLTSQQLALSAYSFTDHNPLLGNNLYRIKLTDNAGTIVYSQTITVNVGDITTDIALYPNPISGSAFNIGFHNIPVGLYHVKLSSVTGDVKFSQDITVDALYAPKPVSTSGLLKGAYLLSVSSDKSAYVKTLIVN